MRSIRFNSSPISRPRVSAPGNRRFVVFDDFDRPDGDPVRTRTGQPWFRFVNGAQSPAAISGKAFVANQNPAGGANTVAYNSVICPRAIRRMRCEVIFGSGITGTGSIALIANQRGTVANGVTDITNASIHIVFNDAQIFVQIWEGGAITGLATLNYATPHPRDGTTVYTLGWSMDPSTNTITIEMPNGADQTVVDSRLTAVLGRYATFEHFWASGGVQTRFLAVWAEA